MTWFCTWIITKLLSIHLLLFSIGTTKKCFGQNFMTFGTKTCRSWNPTQVLHPNHPHILFQTFCCCFASIQLKNVPIKTSWLLVWKLLKLTNQPKMTYFCPKIIWTSFLGSIYGYFTQKKARKTSNHNFITLSDTKTTKADKVENQAKMTWFCTQNIPPFFSVHFPSVHIQKVPFKNSWLLTRKPVEVGNQPKMTRFCTWTLFTTFLVILLLFSISMAKKCLCISWLLARKLAKPANHPKLTCFSQKHSNIVFLGQFVVV